MRNSWTIHEQFMSKLWTRIPWTSDYIVPSIWIWHCRPIFSNCSPLIRRFVGFVSGLAGKPRLCWIMNNSWTVHEQFMSSLWTNPDWFSRPSFWQESTKLGCNMCNVIPSPCFVILSLFKFFSSSSFGFDFICSRFYVHPAKNFHEQFVNSLWTVHERVHENT